MPHQAERDESGDRLAAIEAEIAALREENARLRGLLGLDGRDAHAQTKAWKPTLFAGDESPDPVMVGIDRSSPAAAKVALFRSLFAGRDDVHALRWHNERTGKAGWGPAVRGGWANARTTRVEVHDYVDVLVPVLARMHDERRTAYATLGFDVPKRRRRPAQASFPRPKVEPRPAAEGEDTF